MYRYCEIRERRTGFTILIRENDKTLVDAFISKERCEAGACPAIDMFYSYIRKHHLKRYEISADLGKYIWSEYVSP